MKWIVFDPLPSPYNPVWNFINILAFELAVIAIEALLIVYYVKKAFTFRSKRSLVKLSLIVVIANVVTFVLGMLVNFILGVS